MLIRKNFVKELYPRVDAINDRVATINELGGNVTVDLCELDDTILTADTEGLLLTGEIEANYLTIDETLNMLTDLQSYHLNKRERPEHVKVTLRVSVDVTLNVSVGEDLDAVKAMACNMAKFQLDNGLDVSCSFR